MLTLDASTSLVDYLASKGITTRRASGNEITASCWWCGENRPEKRKLYLNTETWFYDCKVCGEKGNRKTLLRHFGDDERDELRWVPGTDPALKSKALTDGVELAEDFMYGNPAVLDYLQGRGLTSETIVEARLGYAPVNWGLGSSLVRSSDRRDVINAGWLTREGQEFFSGHIVIPYYSHGSVVQVRGKEYRPATDDKPEHTGKYVSTNGADVRLYGSDTLSGARECIVVEGEFDSLMLRQAFRNCGDTKLEDMAVVGLAGAMVLPPHFENMFDSCSRVYIALDPDETGDKATDKLRNLLGSKARTVRLPRDLPKCDWSAYLGPAVDTNPHGGHDWRDVYNLIIDAEAEGRVLFSVRDAQRALSKIEKELGAGMRFQLGDLDKYLDPGVRPGQIFVPLARTGVGKTALMATITHNLLMDPQIPKAGLICSLELTAVEYYDRLRRIARFYNPLLTDREIAEQYSRLRIYDKVLGPGDLTRLCEEFTAEMGETPAFAGVDYLGYASRRWPGTGQYEKVSNAILGLKEEAKAGMFVAIIPHQVGRKSGQNAGDPIKIDDARDSGVVEETADVLTGWYRPMDGTAQANTDQTVSCVLLKSRNGRINVTTHYTFSLASLVLVPHNSQARSIAADENRLVLTGSNYTQVLGSRREQALALGMRESTLIPSR